MTKNYLLNLLLQGLHPILIYYILLSDIQFVSIETTASKVPITSGWVCLTFTGLNNIVVIYFSPKRNTCEFFQVKGIADTWIGNNSIPDNILYDKNYAEILRRNYELVYNKFPTLRYKDEWPVSGNYMSPSILVDKSWLNNPYNRGAK